MVNVGDLMVRLEVSGGDFIFCLVSVLKGKYRCLDSMFRFGLGDGSLGSDFGVEVCKRSWY